MVEGSSRHCRRWLAGDEVSTNCAGVLVAAAKDECMGPRQSLQFDPGQATRNRLPKMPTTIPRSWRCLLREYSVYAITTSISVRKWTQCRAQYAWVIREAADRTAVPGGEPAFSAGNCGTQRFKTAYRSGCAASISRLWVFDTKAHFRNGLALALLRSTAGACEGSSGAGGREPGSRAPDGGSALHRRR